MKQDAVAILKVWYVDLDHAPIKSWACTSGHEQASTDEETRIEVKKLYACEKIQIHPFQIHICGWILLINT